MTQQGAKEKSSLPDWQTQILRCTAFVAPRTGSFSVDQAAFWWGEIAGEGLEKVISTPKEQAVVAGGSFKDGRLMLLCQPTVVELRLQLPEGEKKRAEGTPTIGSFNELQPDFMALAHKFLSTDALGPVNRIAFGAVIHLPVASMAEAYRRLTPYLPNVKLDSQNLYDLLYRCNRRRNSSVMNENLYINRVNTWTAVAFQEFYVIAGTGRAPEQAAEVFAAQLELDINTPANYAGRLPADKLTRVFDELVAMGIEIASQGDTP